MSRLLCIANHSPEQFLSWAHDTYDMHPSEFHLVSFGAKLKTSVAKKSRNIVFISYRDLRRNFELLSHSAFKHHSFYVFAPCFRCAEFTNSIWLDFKNNPEMPGIKYLMTEWRTEQFVAEPGAVSRDKENYMSKVLDRTKSVGTILMPLMTIIYTLKSSTMQKPVTFAICNWIYQGHDADTLERMFLKLRGDLDLTKYKQDKFRELLLSDVGKKAQDACAMIREAKESGKAFSYEAIGNKVGMQAYDLNYIVKVIDNESLYSDQQGVTIKDFQRQAKEKRAAKKAAEEQKALAKKKPAAKPAKKTKEKETTKPKRRRLKKKKVS